MRLTALTPILVAGLLFAWAGPSQAQGQGQPDPAKIRKQIEEAVPRLVEQAEEAKATFGEGDVITITYKKVPTDPKDIAKTLGKEIGGGQIPENVIDQYMGMFAPQIAELLNKHLGDIGTLVNTRELKVKSKKIPPGKHRIGLMFQGEKPVGLVVFDKKEDLQEGQEPLKKPVQIRLKTKSSEMNKTLEIELKEPTKKKKDKDEMDIFVNALRFKAKTSKPLVISPAE